MSTLKTVFVEHVCLGIHPIDMDEAHYVRDVLRLEIGAPIAVADGRGSRGSAILVELAPRRLGIDVRSLAATPAPTPLIVLLGLPKPALVDEALQLGTEAGLTDLWLFPSTYSPPGRPRLDRLERIALAATRQSRREVLPVVRIFPSLDTGLSALPTTGSEAPSRWIAAPGASGLPRSNAAGAILAIGPEAGFSPIETDTFTNAGFVPVGLGPHILRAPTAVAVAVAMCRAPVLNP